MKRKTKNSTTKKRVNSRSVGNQYERDLVSRYRELTGDPEIHTSRLMSKALDDAGVDIWGTDKYGLWIQAKRYANTPPKLHDVLDKMPDDDCINVVYWKKPHHGEVVIMKAEDFESMFVALNNLKGE